MKVRELLDEIRTLDMVLPEFQREYVWSREQAKQLVVSLYNGYPTGSLLLWKTDSPPEIKNLTITPDRIGTTHVILDGQQRLTTLYLLTRGEIPPYYREEDIQNDPRDLYFDLDTGELQYFQVARMRHNPSWVQVTQCFEEPQGVNAMEIARGKASTPELAFELAERYLRNLTALKGVLERDYPIQVVPPSAHIDEAIDVFDRVNSLGTKLTEADLALAHMTGKWPQARQVLKAKMEELAERRFRFDLTFMTRALVAVVKQRALFETIHQTPAQELTAGWERLERILDYLVTLLPGHGHIHSTEDLNTTNVLIPPLAYLARHGGRFPEDREMRRFIHWLYAASVWARYTAQTDQRLDHDISLIQQMESPWGSLVDAIVEQRGRIELKPSDLEGRVIQHPMYRMTFVLAKARGAIDWFNGSPLDAPHGAAYAIHSHHIFPQSLLYGSGRYEAENHLQAKLVNEIANRAFLTGTSNLSLGNTEPADYLPDIERRYPGALAKQFIPMNAELWRIERYEDFLAERRRLISDAFDERMQQLLVELAPPAEVSLEDLFRAGESPVLEYKSTLRWDLRQEQVNRALQKVVAKTVAGFLNFEGGTLLIGVADDGTILGIEQDMDTLGRGDIDGFEQTLRQVLSDYLGPELNQLIRSSYEQRDGGTIAIVSVEPSPRPAYLHDGDKTEFHVRAGNTTRPLDLEAAHDYIQMHWET